MITISIQNFRGIESAAIDVGSITLVAGVNGAGKSSIAQATAAALSGVCPVRGLKKSDYQRLVRNGQSMADVSVSSDAGTSSIGFPDGKAWREGNGPHASEYAAGITSPVELDARKSAEAWQTILQTVPSDAQLQEALGWVPTGLAARAIKDVAMLGYDGAFQKWKDAGAKLKGRWEEVTGAHYGSKIAAQWLPDGFDPAQLDDPREVESARARYEATLKSQGASDAVKAWASATYKCPHCDGAVSVYPQDDGVGYKLVKGIEAGQVAQKIAYAPPADTAAALASLQKAEFQQRAKAAHAKSVEIAREIEHGAAIVSVLSPDGLRKRCLDSALDAFNADLRALSTHAQWARVILESDLSVSYNGSPYQLLSLSEQFRARATIQCAIGKREAASMMVFDGADILTKDGKGGLWKMCQATDIPCLLLMSMDAPGNMPLLSGKNSTYWVEHGEAVPTPA